MIASLESAFNYADALDYGEYQESNGQELVRLGVAFVRQFTWQDDLDELVRPDEASALVRFFVDKMDREVWAEHSCNRPSDLRLIGIKKVGDGFVWAKSDSPELRYFGGLVPRDWNADS